MSLLRDIVTVPADEKPFIDFRTSIDDEGVVAGYIPVQSTLDVLDFLKESCAIQAPKGRAVICWGAYGSGKSRMCAVLAHLFKHGFNANSLKPVWARLQSRGLGEHLVRLEGALMPGGRPWRPFLVVTLFADAGGGTLASALLRGLLSAVGREKLDYSSLGLTIYHAAAKRLDELLDSGFSYEPNPDIPFANAEQLKRALTADFDGLALAEFARFHKEVTVGVDFNTYLASEGTVAADTTDIYIAAAQEIQRHGFDGILVLWDEFGFAIEELLKDSASGRRSLGKEVMELQTFLERASGSRDLGTRITFLAFTHLGLTEYGTRQSLNETDQDRIATVDARFRKPDIAVRLTVSELEGYHLIAGMLRRTPQGETLLQNPLPRLQQIANRMPALPIWERHAVDTCYQEIVSPCYPLHPLASTALLLLSDRIAQVNRTAFYFLHNTDADGFTHILNNTTLPSSDQVGGSELVRANQLFDFFARAIQEREPGLLEQYEEAKLRHPEASELERRILKLVVVLLASKISPTTNYLMFGLVDVLESEVGASPVHEALDKLVKTGALWKNEATDVWGFVGTRGLGGEVDRELARELALVPDEAAAKLFRSQSEIQNEITDLLGDRSLDPAESGVVRRLGVRILNIAKGDNALDEVRNRRVSARTACAAFVYLILTDDDAQLADWRQFAIQCDEPNVYFVVPADPTRLSRQSLRQLIAIRSLLSKKDPESHAYEVLEGKLTRTRRELRATFDKEFGNRGLREDSTVYRGSTRDALLDVESWIDLSAKIEQDLDHTFVLGIKVRCGTYNEWYGGSRWTPICNVVERILGFDQSREWQNATLGFNVTSQEGAIVDGVLAANRFLQSGALQSGWSLIDVVPDCKVASLQEVRRNLTSGTTEQSFAALFQKLSLPPYGVPNAIIPILIALVWRCESSRLTLYERIKGRSVRVTGASEVANAISNIGDSADKFSFRYESLGSSQRLIYRLLGPILHVPFEKVDARGERFFDYCRQIRKALCAWSFGLPEGVLNLAQLTASQKELLRLTMTPVPPQLAVLGEALLAVAAEDPKTKEALKQAGIATEELPPLEDLWKGFELRVRRYVEGVKAPLQHVIDDVSRGDGGDRTGHAPEERFLAAMEGVMSIMGDAKPIAAILTAFKGDRPNELDLPVSVEEVAAAVSAKAEGKLTEEDYGRAVGVLEMASAIRKSAATGFIVVVHGTRISIPPIPTDIDKNVILQAVSEIAVKYSLSSAQLGRLVLEHRQNSSSDGLNAGDRTAGSDSILDLDPNDSRE